MKAYELTERGKIIICVVLVLLIFIIPATVFAVRAWSSPPPPPAEPPASSIPEPDDSVISDGPLPDGSGFDPLEPSEPDEGEQGSFDPVQEPPDDPSQETGEGSGQELEDDPAQEPDDDQPEEPDDPGDPPQEPGQEQPGQPPEVGPVDINRSEGTMSFTFAPGLQDALDTDSAAMLSTFLSSPKNTKDAEITVEIPQLSSDDRSTLISAIVDAFASHGVSRDTLTFKTYQASSDDGSYEVRMGFYQPVKSPK